MATAEVVEVPGSEVYLGVVVEKIDAEKLTNYLEKHGVEFKAKDGVKGLIDAYSRHVTGLKNSGKYGADDFLECDPKDGGCGISSVADLSDVCPGCGAMDEQDPNSIDLNATEGVKKDPTPKAKAAKPAKAKEEKPAKAPKAEIVKAAPAPELAITVEALDQAVARVREKQASACKSYWELGLEIQAIVNSRLYLARKNEAGKPVYKDFPSFCKAELGMAHVTAYDMILVTRSFTKEDVERVGFTKLKTIARLEAPERERLLEAAKSDASLRQILNEKHIIKTGASRPVGGSTGSARRGSIHSQPATPVDTKGKITAVFQLGTVELRINEDPKNKKWSAKEDLVNGVECSYVIDLKKKVMRIVRRRAE